MKCLELEEHMDQIPPSGRIPAELAEHLARCPCCEEVIAKWQVIRRELQELDRENAPLRRIPLHMATQELIGRAESENRRRSSAPHLPKILFLAASILVAVATSLYVFEFHEHEGTPAKPGRAPQTASVAVDGNTVTKSIEEINQVLASEKSSPALLSLNDDTVGIDSKSLVRIEKSSPKQTQIRLERGRVACRVFHRSKGESFEIRGGAFRIRVVGTQFSVSRAESTQLAVAVWEGEVVVTRGTASWKVEKGSRLQVEEGEEPLVEPLSAKQRSELKMLLEPGGTEIKTALENKGLLAPSKLPCVDTEQQLSFDSKKENDTRSSLNRPRKKRHRFRKDDLDKWRSWILDGRHDEACNSLERHLRRHAKDLEAWSLLSVCARKTGRWNDALAAYRQIIKFETGPKKRRAQYRAGAIYQDKLSDPGSAAELFEQYIASGKMTPTMKAEAMVRLARAYLEMGKRRKARELVESVAREHIGTAAAKKAHKMLESMKTSPSAETRGEKR